MFMPQCAFHRKFNSQILFEPFYCIVLFRSQSYRVLYEINPPPSNMLQKFNNNIHHVWKQNMIPAPKSGYHKNSFSYCL